jgi:molybdopterin converting factor small subunit
MLHRRIQSDLFAGLRERYGEMSPEHLEFAATFLQVAEDLIDQYAREI